MPHAVTDPSALPQAVRDEDLVTRRLAHRAARRDVRRLAELIDGLAAGTEPFPERRVLAFGAWVERVCAEVAHQQDAEEQVLWPVLERYGGAGVDVSGLRDDHDAIDAALAEVRRGTRAVVAALQVRPTAVATAADFARVRALAAALRGLADLLDDHLTGTECALDPVLRTDVPRAQWLRIEAEVRRRAADPRFALPWAAEVADGEERAALRAIVGPVAALGLALRRPGHRHRARSVFAPAP